MAKNTLLHSRSVGAARVYQGRLAVLHLLLTTFFLNAAAEELEAKKAPGRTNLLSFLSF